MTAKQRPPDDAWDAAQVAAETPEVLDNLWLPRAETLVVLGGKWFDSDLNPLDGAAADAALEVRLVRRPEEAVCRSRFEIRTTLAFSPKSTGPASKARRQLLTVISDAQRELAERLGLSFAEPCAAKPYVLTPGPRGVVPAHGKRSISKVWEAAQPRLRAYGFLSTIWQAALIGKKAVTLARVRRMAEDAIAPDNMDMGVLFAPRGASVGVSDDRPELTDELLERVGIAVGCKRQPDGLYTAPAKGIAADTHPPGVVRMVAKDIAPARGVDVDTVLRKVLRPMLAGKFNGPMVRYTAAQVAAVRAARNGKSSDGSAGSGKVMRRKRRKSSARRTRPR